MSRAGSGGHLPHQSLCFSCTLRLPHVLLGSGRGSMFRADFTSAVLGLAGGAEELNCACENSQNKRFTVNSQHWPPWDSTALVSAAF